MFTNRQKIFAIYLLKRIGFTDDNLIDKYLSKLGSVCLSYYLDYKNEKHYTYSECISLLLKEVEIKKLFWKIKQKSLKSDFWTSATDLSSFSFCPASYSISRSFVIEHIVNEESIVLGKDFHEGFRLLNKFIDTEHTESDYFEDTVINSNLITKLKKCQLIYSGHLTSEKYFVNEKLKFIGQPDYIFKDLNGDYFVVEEKFKKIKSDSPEYETMISGDHQNFKNKIPHSFFENHIVQLQSYIDYIKDYNVKYGLLIYWYYSYIDGIPMVRLSKFKTVYKNQFKLLLDDTHRKVISLIKNGNYEFGRQVNPNKCAACSVSLYCAHKTSNISHISLPYKKSDLKLRSVDFPTELEKKR